jgi:uncharacterized protein YbaP (TraB family)
MHCQRLRQLILYVINVVFIVTFQFVDIENVAAKSFLWKADSKTATVYLLGSIHMGIPSMYPLPSVMEQAYDKSDYLVLEVNESAVDQSKVQQLMQQSGFYPDAQTLADHVDKRLYHQLTGFLGKQGIPAAPFVKMKPGMIAISLSVIYMQQLGYSPDLGVDRHFMLKANQQQKTILELETMQEQLNLLLDFSDDALLLKQTLSQLDNMKEITAGMVKAWETGDAGQLNTLVIEDPLKENPEYLPVVKKLIFDRNVRMAKKIQGYLASNKTYFVIVGAGHLVGAKGIISLLRGRGFHLEQL